MTDSYARDDGGDIESVLGSYAADLSLDDVPSPVREKASLVVLDTVGVCLRGSSTDYVCDAVDAARKVGFAGADGDATVFANGTRSTPAFAALVNAAGGTTLELDEGNQRSAHMGIHVVPPALATAEHAGASGEELLAAVVAGYEVGARIGDVIRPMKAGLHPHGSWSPIAGAVAVGRLLGFDGEEMATAIRIAANPFVAATWNAAFEGATVRNFYTGIGVEHGIRAATLAEAGVTGVRSAILRSLLPYTADGDVADLLRERVDSLGERYYLTSSYFKMHAACRYSHAPVEALEAALDGRDIGPEAIERITVRTFESGTWLDETRPANVLAAKFSTPYVLAVRLLLGSTDVDAFDEPTVSDPRIRSLMDRIEIEGSEAFDRAAADGNWGAAVAVELTDGSTLTGEVEDARGGGDSPFSPAEVRAKFDRLATGAIGSEADELRGQLLDLRAVENVGTLFDFER